VSALAAAALLLRRLRTEIGILLLLFALVASTSVLFAAAPRLFNRVTDDAVRYAVAQASPVERDVWLYANGFIGAGTGGGVSAVKAYGDARESDFPTSIDGLVSNRVEGFTSVRFMVPKSIVDLSLRYQDGVTNATRLTAGRWPVDLGTQLQQIRVGQDTSGDQAPPTVFEAALSTTEADAIGAHVGDTLNISLDGSDPFIPKTAFVIAPTEIDVVGLFEPIDPSADEWAGSPLLQPSYKQGASGIEAIYATAYVPAEAYANLAAGLLPFHYDWHFEIDPGRLDADQVESLRPDLARLDLLVAPTDTRFMHSVSSEVTVNNVSIGSGLLRIFDGFAAQRARSESVLSIAALGVLGLAAGSIAMVAILLVRRRRSSLLLARGRGAPGRLILGAQLIEAIILAGSAALVGLVLAVVAVPARDAPLSPILAFVVAGSAILVLMAATWPAARRPLMQLERDDPPVFRVPPRRLVIEGTVVVVAVLAVFLLRQRGLALGPATAVASFDPLLAAVPLLSGLAAGIVAMRLYPLPVRWLGRLAARRTDFVAVVGLRTVSRHAATANLPLLVLMLTAAFGAFASVVASSVDHGQVAASYLQTGADFRLEEIGIGGLPPSLDPTTIPGVKAVAAGVVDDTADLVTGPSTRATVDFDAVDTAAYSTVTAGTAADPAWPSAFLEPPSGEGIGTDANPIPAILSAQLPPGIANLGNGDKFTIGVAQQSLTFRLIQRQDDFPGHGNGSIFAIVPLDWVRAAVPGTSFVPTVLWLRASSEVTAPLAAMVGAASEGVRIVSRQDAYAALHDAPLGSAVADYFGVALDVAVLYLAVTLVGAVVLSAAGRTRDVAYLRTLGVSGRQAQALTAVENAPPVLLALIPGVLLGVGVAMLVEPGLGLADFVGVQGVPLFVDWPKLVLVIAILAAVVAVAIGAGTWLAGRALLANALRIEDS
jgi:putative ABC transport system permease protein